MTYNVLMGTLNPTHSLTHSPIDSRSMEHGPHALRTHNIFCHWQHLCWCML